MPEPITTTELLDFLAKADKVSSHTYVEKVTNYYRIYINAPWDDNNNYYTKSTYITAAGYSIWESAAKGYDFFTMSNVLDELIQKEEEREIKRQKREELLSRLTDEEKELLGVK